MTLIDAAGAPLGQTATLAEAERRQYELTIDLIESRIAELELALEDEGWQRLLYEGGTEFTRAGLGKIIALSRLLWLKNPLIQRAVNVKTFYVWGQGVEVQVRDDQANRVVHEMLDERRNRAAVFGSQARTLLDRTLQIDGNVFLTLEAADPVKVRTVPVDEVADIVVDPDDRAVVWFYKRVWTDRSMNLDTGNIEAAARTEWHPDWAYQPDMGERVEQIAGAPVRWERPIMHVRVGGLAGMRFGVPETYSAQDWARAYKAFLEDWASIARSLSRFAWRATSKKRGATRMATRLGSTLDTDSTETNPSPTAGAAFVGSGDVDMAPIPKTGATLDADSGRTLRLMVAAGMDLPDTLLSGDMDQGNLATAKTLDRPTELAAMDRQQLWADVYRDICDWRLTQETRPASRAGVQAPDTRDLTVDVTFPPILEDDRLDEVSAVVTAAGTGLVPAETVLRLLLQALGVTDVDDVMEGLDEQLARQVNVGQLAVDAYRAGRDPADVVGEQRVAE